MLVHSNVSFGGGALPGQSIIDRGVGAQLTGNHSDHFYYNAVINNPSTTNYAQASFADQRTMPILKNASDYFISIVRFRVPTDNIPLFNAVVSQGPAGTTATTLTATQGSATITQTGTLIVPPLGAAIFSGSVFQTGTYVQFVDTSNGNIYVNKPAANTLSATADGFLVTFSDYTVAMAYPSGLNFHGLFNAYITVLPTGTSDTIFTPTTVTSPVYNYNQMITPINLALREGFNWAKSWAAASSVTWYASRSPWIALNSATGLFTLYAQKSGRPVSNADAGKPQSDSWYSSNPSTGSIVNFNSALYTLIQGLPSTYVTLPSGVLPGGTEQYAQIDFGQEVTQVTILPNLPFQSGLAWSATTTYNYGEVVFVGSPPVWYLSLVQNNLNNAPASTLGTDWAYVYNYPPEWSSQQTYATGVVVTYAGSYFQALASSTAVVPLGDTTGKWDLTNAFDMYALTQSYTSLPQWSNFTGIVFLTGMPVNTESLPAVTATPNASPSDTAPVANQGVLTTSDNSRPILTDFEIGSTVADGTPAQYFPQGPYRLTNLTTNGPLNYINFQIFWQDRSLNLYPLIISPEDYASVKIMFRKKSLGL
jgi:hypothetical protein